MATTGSALKRSLVVATIMAMASGCTGSTTSPSATTRPSVTRGPATAQLVTEHLTGGRYLFGPFEDMSSLTIEATGPKGWVGFPSWAMDGPDPVGADAPKGIGISFFSANGLYSDPCHWDVHGTGEADSPGDVKVGPTVDDLVTGLRANTFYTSSAATPVTIDGYSGKELEIQLPDDPYTKCDKDDPADSGGHEFVFSGPGLYAQGRANRWHLYILDVDGARLIAVILSYAKTPQTDLDLARRIIETLDINPEVAS